MKLAIVTACPSGMVTSVLCARLLDAAAQRLGWSTSVEVVDPQHPESRLSTATLDAADWVLVVRSGELDLSRFAGKRLFIATPSEALRDSEAFLLRAAVEAKECVSEAPAAAPAAGARPRIVAVTACPTGVAHTFMAAEALKQAAQRQGIDLQVETQGSVGARDPLSPEAIAAADAVLLATDIEVDTARFAGKKVYRCGTGVALKQAEATLKRTLSEGQVLQARAGGDSSAGKAKVEPKGAYKHLLTGVSYMLPMVVAGYIAYSIADRPGLAPGMIGGLLASTLGAGFIGGIVAGFLAGYSARAINRHLNLPPSVEALKPILIIPLLSSLFTGLVMIYVVGKPVAGMLASLTHFLDNMGTSNAILLGLLLGGMMCVDLGGPINKAAYAFSVGLLASQSYAPMAATMAAGMVPPIGMGIATLLMRRKFAQSEREAGKAALVLGLCFISEGAIPFAAKDPLRVIPASIAGGALTGALSMYFGCKLMAPHGGLFVLLIPNAINHALLYLLAIVAGSLVTGVVYALLKRGAEQEMVLESQRAV